MLRSLNVLFSPEKEWEKMALSPPHPLTVLLLGLIPFMVCGLLVEGYGLTRLGEFMSGFGNVRLPATRILKYEVFYGVASLLVILLGTWLLRSIGESFNLQASFGTCFILMGFGYLPLFLLRCADAIPQMNTWICWAIGAALSFRILYHGVGLWLRPEQTKGFGLFIISMIYTAVLSGLVHFAAVQVLHGKLLKQVYPDTETSAEINPVPAARSAPATK